ncbi:hypothetical protein N7520_007388 [Penicillium odoratum]|uniref:uncharacterized protein n=1 Tax=Penicillium odoratum TaxID=1167516 RepID=UPI0025469DC9|nr:uncharacterized protein N7520_007388 [Penicillium odoratum]KAJ5760232.1 hypothetical protein N7520_007388 [Penicillium odoratum]
MIWRAGQISLFLFSILANVVAHHQPTVYFIRHGEKPDDPNNHELNFAGKMRAQCIRDIFNANSGYDIEYIMAPTTNESTGDHGRPFKTVIPLAEDLGLKVDLHCDSLDPQCVADAIRWYDGPGNILVSWRHRTIAKIPKLLGVTHRVKYPKKRFDIMWTLPYPYTEITEIESEGCYGLDDNPGLIVQN